MTTVTPQTDSLKRAVRWISEQLKENEKANINMLINEANMTFDLSPKDADFLFNMYKKK